MASVKCGVTAQAVIHHYHRLETGITIINVRCDACNIPASSGVTFIISGLCIENRSESGVFNAVCAKQRVIDNMCDDYCDEEEAEDNRHENEIASSCS